MFRSAYSVRQQLISLMEKMSTTTEPCTNEQFDSSDVEEESRFAPSQAQIPGKEWLHIAFALRQRLPKFCFSIHGLLIFLSKFQLVIIALVLLWITYCECTIKSVSIG